MSDIFVLGIRPTDACFCFLHLPWRQNKPGAFMPGWQSALSIIFIFIFIYFFLAFCLFIFIIFLIFRGAWINPGFLCRGGWALSIIFFFLQFFASVTLLAACALSKKGCMKNFLPQFLLNFYLVEFSTAFIFFSFSSLHTHFCNLEIYRGRWLQQFLNRVGLSSF